MLGGTRPLLLGLALARDLGGCELPDRITCRIPAVASLLATAKRNLLTPDFPGMTGRELMRWRWDLLDRNRDRARLCWHMLRPNTLEANFVRLPRLLYPAYFLLRPLRILTTYVR